MGEVFQSDAFFRLMRECNVGCLVEHSDDMLVRSIVGGFVEKHESRSKKLGDILTADALAMMLLNWFKYVRCGMDQFLVIVPKLYEVLLRHSPSQDRHLLGQIYQISGTLEGANETIEYASPYQGHPSASTCLAKSLKEFLSVRKPFVVSFLFFGLFLFSTEKYKKREERPNSGVLGLPTCPICGLVLRISIHDVVRPRSLLR